MKGWSLLLLACLAACGNDSTSPGGGLGSEFTFDDPVGDTALFVGSVDSFPALDARRVSGSVSTDSLVLTIEFANPIARASTGAPNSLVATLAVDADADSNTGLAVDDGGSGSDSFTGPFPARTGLGAEYWIFVDSLSGSDAEVYRILTQESVATYPATYGASSVTIQLPLSVLGVRAGERFRVVGVVGNPQRLTDIIPDSGSYEVGGSS